MVIPTTGAAGAASLPADLQDALDQIDAADRAAEPLVQGLSDRQFNWQPDAGRGWSIAQCLEHLAAINTLYGASIRSGIDLAQRNGWSRRGPLAPTRAGRWFIDSQEPPVKRRVPAPKKVRPASTLTRAEILARYHAAHEQVRALIRDAAAIDANRATFPNPFLPILRVRVATGLYLLPAHDRRHLWQAEQVKRRPDFPSA